VSAPRARVVHEDAAHHASTHREEMSAVLPRHILRVNQAKIRLIDERGRLKAVTGSLVHHVAPRDLMQLTMDKRNQSPERILVAMTPLQEQLGDVRRLVDNAAILVSKRHSQSKLHDPRGRVHFCATNPSSIVLSRDSVC